MKTKYYFRDSKDSGQSWFALFGGLVVAAVLYAAIVGGWHESSTKYNQWIRKAQILVEQGVTDTDTVVLSKTPLALNEANCFSPKEHTFAFFFSVCLWASICIPVWATNLQRKEVSDPPKPSPVEDKNVADLRKEIEALRSLLYQTNPPSAVGEKEK